MSSKTVPTEKKTFWQGVREWIRVIVIALIIAIPVRFFIAEPFIVNGASMDPTFSTGQFLIVDRLTYRFEQPKRGDVIVFEFPYNPSVYYIKRIIGLPGERVRMQNGRIFIEQASTSQKFALEEPYIQSYHLSRDNIVLPDTDKPLEPGQYIVLGDNRRESSDSRVWGLLDSKFIIGRPIIRLTPLTAITILPGTYHETSATQ